MCWTGEVHLIFYVFENKSKKAGRDDEEEEAKVKFE